ncbi:acetolactate synthase catalytic subunit [Chelativorans sp. Marseille-P2723]|uniref:acetolactate synthase catalytic subunit n=1 Tax=Chelativorans sp. Marseille-P2723 TaxID=2709133 RepID=UPI001570DDD2|nr:acetolactate synthase catalytic subunit [Chelativorans sp. Marseille-P2723]
MLIANNVTTKLHPALEVDTPSGARMLAQAFARHGVRFTFGQSIPSLFHLVAPDHGMEQIVYRTENAGGAMADGYSRASNRIALVTAQNGPAAALLVAPLAEALKASVPVIALVQEVSPLAADRNAFQELDHAALFSGVAKWVRRIDHVSRIDDYVDMAVSVSSGGRPGPAVLLVPANLLSAPAASSNRQTSMGTFPLDRPVPDPRAIAEAATLLATARQPLVIAGGGVHLSQAQEALADLQERFHLPVATTLMGKGAVDERHPLSLGIVGHVMGEGSRSETLHDFVRGADVILLVGNRTNENGTSHWRLYPSDATYLHLDIDGLEVGRNYEAHRLVGDARAGLLALADALAGQDCELRRTSRPAVEAVIAAARRHYRAALEARLARKATHIRPESVMVELDTLLSPESIVVSDASYASVWTANYLTAQRPGMRFLSPRGLAGLGWGLPMAIGAKIACPESDVICVTGDGGFAHCWAELETAVRQRLKIPVLVLNNQILGYQKDAEDALFGAHTEACTFEPVDHAALARACGAEGIRVSSDAEISGALKQALSQDGPTVIDIITDPAARPPLTFYRGRFVDA